MKFWSVVILICYFVRSCCSEPWDIPPNAKIQTLHYDDVVIYKWIKKDEHILLDWTKYCEIPYFCIGLLCGAGEVLTDDKKCVKHDNISIESLNWEYNTFIYLYFNKTSHQNGTHWQKYGENLLSQHESFSVQLELTSQVLMYYLMYMFSFLVTQNFNGLQHDSIPFAVLVRRFFLWRSGWDSATAINLPFTNSDCYVQFHPKVESKSEWKVHLHLLDTWWTNMFSFYFHWICTFWKC